MSRESTDELREKLLADPEVHLMIRMRAFEIYQMRGGEPGNPATDWFRAETEVLAFLIDEENRRAAEEAQPSSPETVAGVELASDAQATADPETSIGAWSATEPAGMELAPEIGGSAPMATPKKTRPPVGDEIALDPSRQDWQRRGHQDGAAPSRRQEDRRLGGKTEAHPQEGRRLNNSDRREITRPGANRQRLKWQKADDWWVRRFACAPDLRMICLLLFQAGYACLRRIIY
jgi:hypothetical protein